ncbi:Vesicle transport protein SFT2B [Grifola frondosa]|uniref:Protein transport protein SFT2 n=1 Tax=Grifola frondosa TaxID=5627 RepID=A0A1C7MFP2_GRIFR|nr:Vesicle transport protein SFT2B [Grifola frondosa]
MASKGWFNIETTGGVVPDTQFFEGDSAFSFLGLTRTQRLYGFIGCLALGFVLSILGSILLFVGLTGSFAVLYVLGTVISLVGTGFLLGFTKQLKMMFKPVRVVATIILLGAIILVFIGAFVIGSDILCIIFVIIEYLAYTWYLECERTCVLYNTSIVYLGWSMFVLIYMFIQLAKPSQGTPLWTKPQIEMCMPL